MSDRNGGPSAFLLQSRLFTLSIAIVITPRRGVFTVGGPDATMFCCAAISATGIWPSSAYDRHHLLFDRADPPHGTPSVKRKLFPQVAAGQTWAGHILPNQSLRSALAIQANHTDYRSSQEKASEGEIHCAHCNGREGYFDQC
jgi:hypothetical protein